MAKFDLKIPLKNRFSKTKIAIILPYFNEDVGLKIYEKTRAELLCCGVKKQNITLVRVPGSLEIPFAASRLARKKSCDAIIALGAIIKGETDHYTHVCRETYRGLMDVNLETDIPVIFGVLTAKNRKQAIERISKGKDFARNALKMVEFCTEY
ncbi:6,7-dimethyl-8-ribityllumazine synthase [Candidatus Peregrinibacteria bacterium]|nr:6,7-dimethyl-8-ribityllumazine synthase [Candidatus Peregrinibacteria bacterium]